MQFPLAMARFHQAEKLLTFEDAKLTSLQSCILVFYCNASNIQYGYTVTLITKSMKIDISIFQYLFSVYIHTWSQ
jgi:hypothetical protein